MAKLLSLKRITYSSSFLSLSKFILQVFLMPHELIEAEIYNSETKLLRFLINKNIFWLKIQVIYTSLLCVIESQ